MSTAPHEYPLGHAPGPCLTASGGWAQRCECGWTAEGPTRAGVSYRQLCHRGGKASRRPRLDRSQLSPASEAALRAKRLRERFPPTQVYGCARCGWSARTLARELCGTHGIRRQARILEPLALAALVRRGVVVLCQACAVGHRTELHHPAGHSAAPAWTHAIDVRFHRLVHFLSGWARFDPALAGQLPGWLRAAFGAGP